MKNTTFTDIHSSNITEELVNSFREGNNAVCLSIHKGVKGIITDISNLDFKAFKSGDSVIMNNFMLYFGNTGVRVFHRDAKKGLSEVPM